MEEGTVEILEQCTVSPPPGSVPPTTSPLTFFDLLWLSCPSVQHLLFYDFPSPHYPNLLLSHLKHSLSLALSRFHFLAGHLTWPSHSSKPTITYTHSDSVSLKIAQSNCDFHHLVADYARHANHFHPLVPPLTSSDSSTAVFALQVTFFPNNGLCIGFTINHGVADGSTALQFLNTWAAICRSGFSFVPEPVVYDRSMIKDPDGLEQVYLQDLKQFRGALKSLNVANSSAATDAMVRETFVLTRAHVQRLSQWLARLVEEKKMPKFYESTFVLACAYALVCLVKARGDEEMRMKKRVQIGFATGCRTRLGYPIPKGYFGNCIGVCWTKGMERELLKGREGFLVASEGIGSAIAGLENGVLRGAEKWVKKSLFWKEEEMEKVMIAGTLKLSFYEVDFGFGRPRKSEVVSNERKGGISLVESRDGAGGVELGLALSKSEMDVFSSLFVTGLTALE